MPVALIIQSDRRIACNVCIRTSGIQRIIIRPAARARAHTRAVTGTAAATRVFFPAQEENRESAVETRTIATLPRHDTLTGTHHHQQRLYLPGAAGATGTTGRSATTARIDVVLPAVLGLVEKCELPESWSSRAPALRARAYRPLRQGERRVWRNM
jgi:hypothetical protein